MSWCISVHVSLVQSVFPSTARSSLEHRILLGLARSQHGYVAELRDLSLIDLDDPEVIEGDEKIIDGGYKRVLDVIWKGKGGKEIHVRTSCAYGHHARATDDEERATKMGDMYRGDQGRSSDGTRRNCRRNCVSSQTGGHHSTGGMPQACDGGRGAERQRTGETSVHGVV